MKRFNLSSKDIGHGLTSFQQRPGKEDAKDGIRPNKSLPRHYPTKPSLIH
jgi:hypothetical protein